MMCLPEENLFHLWDWVGGRFSVWGAVGLPIMIALGSDAFMEFLKGANEMDLHSLTAPLAQNLPRDARVDSLLERDAPRNRLPLPSCPTTSACASWCPGSSSWRWSPWAKNVSVAGERIPGLHRAGRLGRERQRSAAQLLSVAP